MLPFFVKGGAGQNTFRRCLASHYALIFRRDNPPVSQSVPPSPASPSAIRQHLHIAHPISHHTSAQLDFNTWRAVGSARTPAACLPNFFPMLKIPHLRSQVTLQPSTVLQNLLYARFSNYEYSFVNIICT
jgi:hypothetical protein